MPALRHGLGIVMAVVVLADQLNRHRLRVREPVYPEEVLVRAEYALRVPSAVDEVLSRD